MGVRKDTSESESLVSDSSSCESFPLETQFIDDSEIPNKSELPTLDGLQLSGKSILLRTDINSPLYGNKVKDCLRFEKAVETIRELQEEDASIAILAHQGRPGDDEYRRLDQHFEILDDYLDQIAYCDEIISKKAISEIESLENGEALLLENVRFLAEEMMDQSAEKHSESLLVSSLSPYFDYYINDAFSVSHRPHASLMGFPLSLESYIGRITEKEIISITKLVSEKRNPKVLVLGGSKPEEEIEIIRAIGEDVDKILLSGVIADLALIAMGYRIGKQSWLKNKNLLRFIEDVKLLLERYPKKIEVPSDLAYKNREFRMESDVEEFSGLPFDIGSKTIKRYADIIQDAEMILMKGPPGAFEDGRFRRGTEKILDAIVNSESFSMLGGGHTSSLVREFGYDVEDFTHVSIAGGALMRLISGKRLPALQFFI